MRLSNEFRTSLDTMAAQYERALAQDAAALSYLRGRGIEESQAAYYRLGLVDGSFPEHEDYVGRICFPYLTRLGGVVSLKFRVAHDCTDDHAHAKYITPYETRMYNTLAFDRADQLGYIGICEGEIDAITADANCGIPSVGIPGVDTWKQHKEWRELFRGYEHVFMFRDNDPDRTMVVAGQEVTRNPGKELSRRILSEIDTAKLVSLPGKDVNETYLTYGAETIREAAGLHD